jgi:hypothetical protein
MKAAYIPLITALSAILLCVILPLAAEAEPSVTNVKSKQVPGTHKVEILYDLSADSPSTVDVYISDDGGSSYNVAVPPAALSGDIGVKIAAGNRKIEVDADMSDRLGNVFSKLIRFKVVASIDHAAGIVAYYPFDGNAEDASGNNRNLASSGVTPTVDRFGRSDAAYNFDGFDDWLHVDNIPEPSNNAFSWALWIRPAVIPSGAEWGQWVLNRNNANSFDFMVSPHLTLKPGGTIMFTSYDNRLDGNQNWMNALSSNTKLVVDQWYHIVCTSGIDNTRRIYINGVLDSSLVSSGYGQTGLGTINIGADRNPHSHGAGWPGWFQGIIDDVRIYGRELAAAEVTSLYGTQK